MPNDDQVRILELGISAWNEWRQANPNVKPNLAEADLRGLDVARYDHNYFLEIDQARYEAENEMRTSEWHTAEEEEIVVDDSYWPSDLPYGFDLNNADLTDARLDGANFSGASFARANLKYAHLDGADLSDSSFEGANLHHASLQGVNLSFANLTRANLISVALDNANLFQVRLDECVMTGAFMMSTVLANNDLSKVIGMDQVSHYGPSRMLRPALPKLPKGGNANAEVLNHWSGVR